MTAYATVDDVKARAGRLRKAFNQADAPSDGEIQTFLDQVAGELDASMGALGIGVPVVDATAVRALAGVNADGAFLLAVPGAFPTDAAMANANAMVAEARRRYDRARGAIDAGTFSAVVLLLSQSGTGTSDATDFWSENPGYDNPGMVTARGLRVIQGDPSVPGVWRKMGF